MSRFILCLGLLVTACSTDKASGGEPEPSGGQAAPAASAGRTVKITVTAKGFEPSPIEVEKGKPLTLLVTRKTDDTCAKDLIIPDHSIKRELPLDKEVAISFTPDRAGELTYGCSMDRMVAGVLNVR
jgi:plastocyanin domain-containing protein